MKNSNPIFEGIEFAQGVDSKSAITRKVRQDFSSMLKNGLAKGERTVTNYKRTYPLIVRGRSLSFYHPYSSQEELEENVYETDFKVYIKFVNGINFECVFGNPYRSREIRTTVKRILTGEYTVQESKIKIDSGKIVLFLSLSIPVTEPALDENTYVCVKLGESVTATCCVNTPDTAVEFGDADAFITRRKYLKHTRERLQSSLKTSKGGHGRKRKLQAYDKVKIGESNWVKTYNHQISRQIVDFAVVNKAKTILLEDLSSYKKDEFLTTDWSYSQLQELIKYKAALNNVGVQFIKIDTAATKEMKTEEFLEYMYSQK